MSLRFHILSFMILPGFSSDGPDGHKTSSGVVGLAAGALFCFLLLTITFLWWRNVYPYLQAFGEWLSERTQKAKGYFSQKRPQTVVLPPPDSPRTTDPILLPPPPFIWRHHGPDSVDTLPRYTPYDRPSTPSAEHSGSTTRAG